MSGITDNNVNDTEIAAQDMSAVADLFGDVGEVEVNPEITPSQSPPPPPPPPSTPPVDNTGVDNTGGVQTPEQQAAQAEEPKAPEIDDEVLIQMMLGAQQTQQQPQAVQEPQQAAEQQVEMFTPFTQEIDIPDAIVTNLFSEDVNVIKKTLGGMLTSTANAAAHAGYMKSRAEFENLLNKHMQNQQQQTVQQQQNAQIFNEFYTTFPDLKNYQKVVGVAVSTLVAREQAKNPNATWTPELRDAIGNYSRALIARLSNKQTTANTAMQPANFNQGNARPPMQNVTQQNLSGIEDLFEDTY